MAAAKRKADPTGSSCGEPSRKKRRVVFQDVTIFYFNRRQGFVCVPSQGGNTLGMEDDHFAVEVVSIEDHLAERRGDGPEDAEDSLNLLLPVDSKERRTVLRSAGVEDIEVQEKDECRELRVSRQQCGCSCVGACLPSSCGCAQGGIMCQVDRPGFPCGCTLENCANPSGRLEFNPVKVRTHFVKTIMRTRLEEARYLHQPPGYFSSNLGYLAHLYGAEANQWSWDQVSWWTNQTNSEEESTESSEEDSDNELSNSQCLVAEIMDDILDDVVGKTSEAQEAGASLEEVGIDESVASSSHSQTNLLQDKPDKFALNLSYGGVDSIETVRGEDGYSYFRDQDQGDTDQSLFMQEQLNSIKNSTISSQLSQSGFFFGQVRPDLEDGELEFPCFNNVAVGQAAHSTTTLSTVVKPKDEPMLSKQLESVLEENPCTTGESSSWSQCNDNKSIDHIDSDPSKSEVVDANDTKVQSCLIEPFEDGEIDQGDTVQGQRDKLEILNSLETDVEDTIVEVANDEDVQNKETPCAGDNIIRSDYATDKENKSNEFVLELDQDSVLSSETSEALDTEEYVGDEQSYSEEDGSMLPDLMITPMVETMPA